MKLYATTTSERASKGQGGEWLDIEIMGHDKIVIARVLVRISEEHGYTVESYPVAYPDMLKMDIKGHGYRVKRELSVFEKTGSMSGYCTAGTCKKKARAYGVCDKHMEQVERDELTKGEKKKDECKVDNCSICRDYNRDYMCNRCDKGEHHTC